MTKRTTNAILRWKRAGMKVWAIANAFERTEAEVAKVLLAHGYPMLLVDHPQERKPHVNTT